MATARNAKGESGSLPKRENPDLPRGFAAARMKSFADTTKRIAAKTASASTLARTKADGGSSNLKKRAIPISGLIATARCADALPMRRPSPFRRHGVDPKTRRDEPPLRPASSWALGPRSAGGVAQLASFPRI